MSAAPGPVVVVDTDVVSFIFKQDTRAGQYRRHLLGKAPVVSFMTLAELDQWALEHRWGARRQAQLVRHLADYAVHPFNRELCRWWAAVRVNRRRLGRPIGVADAWVAATALFLNAPLLTHNPGHYISIPGLTVISGTSSPGG